MILEKASLSKNIKGMPLVRLELFPERQSFSYFKGRSAKRDQGLRKFCWLALLLVL